MFGAHGKTMHSTQNSEFHNGVDDIPEALPDKFDNPPNVDHPDILIIIISAL